MTQVNQKDPFEKIPRFPENLVKGTGPKVVLQGRIAPHIYKLVMTMKANIGYPSVGQLLEDFFEDLFNRKLVYSDNNIPAEPNNGKIQDLERQLYEQKSLNTELKQKVSILEFEAQKKETAIVAQNSIQNTEQNMRYDSVTNEYASVHAANTDTNTESVSANTLQIHDTVYEKNEDVKQTNYSPLSESEGNLEKLQKLNEDIERLIEEKTLFQIENNIDPDLEEESENVKLVIDKFEEFKTAVDLTFDWIVEGAAAYKVIFKKDDFYKNLDWELAQLQ